MFLCDQCHDARVHVDLFRSRGRCEGCGKTAACIDCHYLRCDPPVRKTSRKKRKKQGVA